MQTECFLLLSYPLSLNLLCRVSLPHSWMNVLVDIMAFLTHAGVQLSLSVSSSLKLEACG
jgi:hypothetical protein